MDDIKVKVIDVGSILNKTNLPVGGYSANPYVGCPHGCRYCYARTMRRSDRHTEPWGMYADVKHWRRITDLERYRGQRVVIGSVTDGYNPLEAEHKRTRSLLEQLERCGAKVLIVTKSDLVLRDIDILRRLDDPIVAFSVNTLDEGFREDMDRAVSIRRRLDALKVLDAAGIRTVCFISPIFPGITDVFAILEEVHGYCDQVWMENLNLRGPTKAEILDYINRKHPDLVPLYRHIYGAGDRGYWEDLDRKVSEYAEANGMPYVQNYLGDARSEPGHPTIVNYFYHEEVRGTENTGVRRRS